MWIKHFLFKFDISTRIRNSRHSLNVTVLESFFVNVEKKGGGKDSPEFRIKDELIDNNTLDTLTYLSLNNHRKNKKNLAF